VETGAVEPGVADMNGCCDGVEFWVEMKATKAWTIDVKASQVAWHKLRQSKGGRTFFAVRRHSDELYLFSGKEAERLREAGLRGPPALLRSEGGPARWPWEAILKLLLGP
jgi:hypothetical protein